MKKVQSHEPKVCNLLLSGGDAPRCKLRNNRKFKLVIIRHECQSALRPCSEKLTVRKLSVGAYLYIVNKWQLVNFLQSNLWLRSYAHGFAQYETEPKLSIGM